MRHKFFGGINPVMHKENTKRKPIVRIERGLEQVVLPLGLNGGECALPAVKPGDSVCVGQPLAAGREGAAAVHASVSGRVLAVEDRPVPWGGAAPCVVIENDGKEALWPGRPEPLEPNQVDLDLLLARVREAGVAGMGGTGRPTADKLALAAGKIDTLIVNAVECEPYLTADHRLLLERSDKILQGTRVLARVLGAKRALLVTEGDKLNAAEAVERRLRKKNSRVELLTVGIRYPVGGERQLVYSVTGREVPPGGSPVDVKCVVLNVATVFAVQDALFRGKALTHRTVTVTGGAVARPRNLWVPIGTPLRSLLAAVGGLREEPALILAGGPMMGIPQTDLSAPVVKNTGGLVCLTKRELRRPVAEAVCIHCGKCLHVCPMRLAPALIARAVRQGEARLSALHPEDCISCGSCSYICPARIPLTELVAQAGGLVKEGRAV